MAWLKLDDGFTKHPKFNGWTPALRWAWLEVMEYCARYKTHGRIPDDLSLMPRSTTKSLLAKAESSGLIDRADDGGMVVHDWPIYNGETVAERVAYYLAKHPDASANEVCSQVGGTREVVIKEVARQKAAMGSDGGPEGDGKGGSDSGSVEPPLAGSETGSETGTHTREPVPSPEVLPRAVTALRPAERAADERTAQVFQIPDKLVKDMP